MIDLFRERLEAVDARLHVVTDATEAADVARDLAAGGSVAAWPEAPLATDAAAVDADVSLIVADVGIAETGQIGFAHDQDRPREVALLPDRQIALLPRANLVLSAHEALLRLRGASHVVLVAGPSRTADIEQRMMLGVHAPRSLDVIVFG